LEDLIDLSFETLRTSYLAGGKPHAVVAILAQRINSAANLNAWIHVEPTDRLMAACDSLEQRPISDLPLFGIPFAVKDNIDVVGMPTTAACPDFSYVPARSARSVELLQQAGAICIGKANLDQFATGLSGARSPYGACSSVGNPLYVAGGSSSGSAVAVALKHVSFSLGTDTGGSGRIPAGFNGVVGIKPTLGRVSSRGIVPNCRSLDCVSVFSNTVAEGSAVLDVLTDYDIEDPFSRPLPDRPPVTSLDDRRFRFGRLGQREVRCFGMDECATLYERGCERLEVLGGEPVIIDFSRLAEVGELLFGGPWIAERRAALSGFISKSPASVLDVVRGVIAAADRFSAVDTFNAMHRLKEIKRTVDESLSAVSFMVVPTAPRPFTIEEMSADPVGLNNRLGYYSYCANLLDLCALAVPNGTLSCGVQMGLTLLAPAWQDEQLAAFGEKLSRFPAIPLRPS
jgi:allophanate hydrolase